MSENVRNIFLQICKQNQCYVNALYEFSEKMKLMGYNIFYPKCQSLTTMLYLVLFSAFILDFYITRRPWYCIENSFA